MTFKLPVSAGSVLVAAFEAAIDALIESVTTAAAVGYPLHDDTTAGLAATDDGEGFSVFDESGLSLYVNDAGAADLQGTVPLSSVTDAIDARVADLEAVGAKGAQFADGGVAICATTANITLSGEQTIDGVTTSTDRVLVKDQTDPAENGIYVSAAGAWSRATDMDTAGEVAGTAISVKSGTANGDKSFATYSAVETLGTDDIEWIVVSDASAYSAALALKADADDAVLTGDVDMGGADSVTVPDGTADGHAVNKGQLDAAVGNLSGVVSSSDLADMVVYSGSGPIYPLAIDAANRALIWHDANADRVFLAGDGAVAERVTITGTPSSAAKQAHIWYGQSNATGAGSGSVITTSQPYSNVMFNGGAKPGSEQNYAETTSSLYTSFSALVETFWETPVSACCNISRSFAAYRGENPNGVAILGACLGHGGYGIDGLEDGSAWYTDPLSAAISAMVSIDSDYEVAVMHYVQGETEQIAGTVTLASYKASLEGLQADFEADVQTATSQTAGVYMLAAQISDIFDGGTPYSEISEAILAAAQDNSKIFLTVPLYYLSYGSSDALHINENGKIQLAGYHARAADQIAQGYEPRWLNPLAAWSVDNVVYVKFDVPVQPLVFDDSRLGTVTGGGFAVEDSGGIMTISAYEAYGDMVKLTLSATPSGSTEVRCAIDYAGGGLPDASSRTGVSTLRDSAPDTINVDGDTFHLYNPAPHFSLPVYAVEA